MNSNTVHINTEEELIAYVNSIPYDEEAHFESIKRALMHSDRIWITRSDFVPAEIEVVFETKKRELTMKSRQFVIGVYGKGYCSCCGVQRDNEGSMKHDKECMWSGAADVDKITEDGERMKIFCPYIPEIVKNDKS